VEIEFFVKTACLRIEAKVAFSGRCGIDSFRFSQACEPSQLLYVTHSLLSYGQGAFRFLIEISRMLCQMRNQ
jgi:hypothetical protein